MADPATHRVTVDGLEMDLDDNGEIVRVWSEPAPSCEPTYALSHRFGWPDASGVMRCACGAWSDSPAARPCRIHAPAISDLREPFEQSMNIAEYVVIVQAEHMAPDDPDDEERQRCERLGVEWVGPDVQDDVVSVQLADLSGQSVGNLVARTAERYGLTWGFDESVGVYGAAVVHEIESTRRRRESLANLALAYDEERAETGLEHVRIGVPCHGGIVRLGCELREADGVTPVR